MKEASGELNMTVIVIVAIAAIAAFAAFVIYPTVKNSIKNGSNNTGNMSYDSNGNISIPGATQAK